MTLNERVETKKLVQWAINDELPKGQAVSRDVWTAVEQHSGHRGGVDLATGLPPPPVDWEAAGGYVYGDTRPDAIVLARLIRTFDRSVSPENADVARDILGGLAMIDPNTVIAGLAVRPNAPTPMKHFAMLKKARG